MSKIVKHKDSFEEAYESLQLDLKNLQNWSTENRSIFNPSKCESFLISRKLTPLNLPNFTINNVIIPHVKKIKLLGLEIDSKLTFSDHIENLAISASKALGQFFRCTRYIKLEVRAILYKTIVRSRLEYASPNWSSASQKALSKLDKIQKGALRILKIQYSISFNILPLVLRRRTGSILLFDKYHFSPFCNLEQLITPRTPRKIIACVQTII